MMKKRLSKTIWYGSEVDLDGNPVIPKLAESADDLEGLHHGELYLHETDNDLSLWARTITNQVKPIGGLGGGSLWKLMQTESGEKYLMTELNVVTQKGITSFANVGDVDLPGLYDGLPIDNQSLKWKEYVADDGSKVKVLVAEGGGEGKLKGIGVDGNGNAITSVYLADDGTKLMFRKDKEFVDKAYLDSNFLNKELAEKAFVTLTSEQTITGKKDFTGGLLVNGKELIYNAESGFWELNGDLLVTGGISSYSSSTAYKPSTVMDGVVTDNQTIKVNEHGQLEVIQKATDGVKVKIVSAGDAMNEQNVLYVIV